MRGHVLATGLTDSGHDRHYAVIKADKGRAVYAEFEIRGGKGAPAIGAEVVVTPASPRQQGQGLARVSVLQRSRGLGR